MLKVSWLKTTISALPVHGILALLTLAATSSPGSAVPLRFEMTQDELMNGRAVLLGDLSDAAWSLNAVFQNVDALSLDAVSKSGGATKHWSSTVVLRRIRDEDGGVNNYGIHLIFGRHISDPPPHPGEASPGPQLRLSGGGTGSYFRDLLGISGGPAQLTGKDEKQHEDDYDTMRATLIDVNSDTPSFLSNVFHEIRANVLFQHSETRIPEPAAPLVFAPALLALAALGGQSKHRGRPDPHPPLAGPG